MVQFLGLFSVAVETHFQGAPWLRKVMEFRETIFQAWKVKEDSKGHGK